jgi:hypothetical protein
MKRFFLILEMLEMLEIILESLFLFIIFNNF